MIKNILPIVFAIFFTSCKAQQPTPSNEIVKTFASSKVLQGARFGISIRALKTGKKVVSVHDNDNFAPASNLKLLYTLAAIDKLGNNFRYTTKFFAKGILLKTGLFKGDIVIQPNGDPSFGSLRMHESLDSLLQVIVNKIKQRDIHKLSGKLIMQLNGWRYPIPGSTPVEDVGNYYGTGAWDFNFNDNRVDIYLKRSTQIGAATKVLYTKPAIAGFSVISKVKTAAPETSDEGYIFGASYAMPRYIIGTIPAGKKPFRVKGGIPNPPLSFLKILKQKLKEAGIEVGGVEVQFKQDRLQKPFWVYKSKPLLDLVKITNDYSMNHFSEAFAWLLVQGDKPADGYIDKQAIHDFFAPYGFEEADIEDGCGLAPDNLVQPAQMTNYLYLMSKRLGKQEVLDILPHGGIDGYAKYFLRKSPYQNQVWVKSGSVSKVRNYTGIFKGQSGKYYSFSVMTNMFIGKHKEVRIAIEKLVASYIKKL